MYKIKHNVYNETYNALLDDYTLFFYFGGWGPRNSIFTNNLMVEI